MKKTLMIVVMCAMMFFACACAGNIPEQTVGAAALAPQETAKDTAPQSLEPTPVQSVTLPQSQYIRTGVATDDRDYSVEVVIPSLSALYDFYQNNKTSVVLWTSEARYYDTTVGFIDAVEKYDEAFFEHSALIIVLKGEPTGSNRHRVSKVSNVGGVLHVSIDRLMPEMGTSDWADWLIIAEVPQALMGGDEVRVTYSDVSHIPEYPKPVYEGMLVAAVSGGERVVPAETTMEFIDYDPDTDERTTTDFKPDTLGDVAQDLTALTVARDLELEMAYGGGQPMNVVVYDAALKEIDTFEMLSVGAVMQQGPGEYYVSFDMYWSGNYMDAQVNNDRYLKRYFLKLEMTDEAFGLAGQLADLGSFKWPAASPQLHVEAAVRPGDMDTVGLPYGGHDGSAQLLTILRAWDGLPVQKIAQTPERPQEIRLTDPADGVPMVLYPADGGLYIKTEDGSYKLSAPPWLFDRMAAAVCGGRLLTFDEAVAIARREVTDTHYGEYITADSAAFGTVQRGGYGPEWVITLVGSDGEREILVHVTINGNYVGLIDGDE